MDSTREPRESTPEEVSRITQDTTDVAGDATDQAERLSMVMESEAIHAALHPGTVVSWHRMKRKQADQGSGPAE